ncbi:MAG: hypothetical protein PSW75_02430 [bacterium]|nr:hypothetical protein [bacterium]
MLALRQQLELPISIESLAVENAPSHPPFVRGLAGVFLPSGKIAGLTWSPLEIVKWDDWPIALASPLSLVAPAPAFFGGELADLPRQLGEKAAKKREEAKRVEQVEMIKAEELRNVALGFEKQARLATQLLRFDPRRYGEGHDLFHFRPVLGQWLVTIKAPTLPAFLLREIDLFLAALGFGANAPMPSALPARQYDSGDGKSPLKLALPALVPPGVFARKLVYYERAEDAPQKFRTRWTRQCVGNKEFILPLNSSVFEKHGMAEVVEGFSLTPQKDGWLAQLTLGAHVESHRYSSEDVVPLRSVPVAAIWPAVSRSQWRRYYAYLSTGNFELVDTQNRPVTFVAKPYGEQGQAPRRGGSQVVAFYDSAPQIFPCFIYEGSKKKEIPCGVLLPQYSGRPAARQEDADVQWDVAVDFGTTTTVVWYAPVDASGKQGESVPFDLVAPDLHLVSGFAEDYGEELREHFIQPAVFSDAAFLTLLNLSGDAAAGEEKDWPLIRANIFVPPDHVSSGFVPDSVRGDLKWGKSDFAGANIRIFILQLLTQIAARAAASNVGRIQLRYTFPTAMDSTHRTWVENAWAGASATVKAWSGIEVEVRACVAEAVATGIYFRTREHGVKLQDGAVTLDIGGGTTDIGLWGGPKLNDSLRSHSSVLYAGQALLLQTIIDNVDAFVDLDKLAGSGVSPWTDELQRAAKAKDKKTLEAIVRQRGDEWYKGLKQENDPAARSLLAFRLGAIFYYAGMLWRFDRQVSGDALEPRALCCGGSAAQLINWLSPLADFGPNFAVKIFQAAAGLTGPNPTFCLGTERKREVVKGLLDTAALEGIAHGLTYLKAGEDFVRNGNSCSAADDLESFGGIDSVSLKNLLAYTAAFRTAIKGSDLPAFPAVTPAVEREVANRLENSINPAPKMSLQPLFFRGLEELISVVPGFKP